MYLADSNSISKHRVIAAVPNLSRHVTDEAACESIDSDDFMEIVEAQDTTNESLLASKLFASLKEEAKPIPNSSMSGKKNKRPGNDNKAHVATKKAAKSLPEVIAQVNNPGPSSLENVSRGMSLPSAHNNRGLTYIKSDLGPYKAVISLKPTDNVDSVVKIPMDVEVSRSLIKCGVRFSLIERISRNKWYITFVNKMDANDAISNKFIPKSRFIINIPWFLVFRKVVIKGVPLDVTNEELWNELKESNANLTFDKDDIYRLKARSFVEGETKYVDSTSVKLSLRAASVPSNVLLWRTRLEMSPYVPNIRQCFNCGQLNHSTKFCKNAAKCLACGQDRHEDGNPCSNILCCINCKGCHRSLSRECPEIIIKRKTTELMATQNIDYNSARKIVLHGSSIQGQGHHSSDTRPSQRRSTVLNPASLPTLNKPSYINNEAKPYLTPVRKLNSPVQDSYSSVTASKPSLSPSLNNPSLQPNLSSEDINKLLNFIKLLSNTKVLESLKRIAEDSKPPDSQVRVIDEN